MKKRISWIDIARLIGILTIILAHSSGPYAHTLYGNMLFAINVPIFFILSGYLFRIKDYKTILKSGFFNLLLPYSATAIILILISALKNKFNFEILTSSFPRILYGIKSTLYAAGTSNPVILGHPLNIIQIGAIWFLPAMFIANLLFNSILKVRQRFSISDSNLSLIILLISYFGFILAKFAQLPWSLPAVLISLIFYWAGFLIKKYDFVSKGNLSLFIIALIIWAVSAKIGPFYINVGYAANPIVAIIGGIFGSYSIMIFSKLMDKLLPTSIINVLTYIGKLSLIILCFHLIDLQGLNLNYYVLHSFTTIQPLNTIAFSIYRILFAVLMTFIIPHILGIRSIFMYRDYPIFKKK